MYLLLNPPIPFLSSHSHPKQMQCCGINGYKDWAEYPYGNGTNVADGCCRNQTLGCGVDMLINPNVTDLVYSRGCLTFVTSAFGTICLALGILTFALVCFQVRE